MYPTPSPQRVVARPPPDSTPGRSVAAPATWALIALNVIVFAGQLRVGGLHGLQDMSEAVLLAFGANHAGATLYEGRFETLLSSCFVHGSLMHIAFNLLALRQVGPFVERAVGASRMLPMYLLSGVVGSVASTFSGWISGGQHISVGASGAICGLIGAGAVLGYRIEGRGSPVLRQMGGWLVSLLVMGLAVTFLFHAIAGHGGGFDNAAHAGGAAAGAVTASVWRRGNMHAAPVRAAIIGLCGALLVATAIRVYRFDLNDPFATFTVDDRVVYAARALDQGRCDDARMALDSLERLTLRAPEVTMVEQTYKARCFR